MKFRLKTLAALAFLVLSCSKVGAVPKNFSPMRPAGYSKALPRGNQNSSPLMIKNVSSENTRSSSRTQGDEIPKPEIFDDRGFDFSVRFNSYREAEEYNTQLSLEGRTCYVSLGAPLLGEENVPNSPVFFVVVLKKA